MNKQDIKSERARVNRFMTIRNPQPQQKISEDQKTLFKRRVSCGQRQTVKASKENSPPNGMSNFSTKPHYKISTEVICFEMEEQRNIQMKTITSNKQLQSYYLAFKRLFIILYQASHLINQHRLDLNLQLFESKSIVFLCLIFQQSRDKWTSQLLDTFMPLVDNVIYLANNPNEFQRRIDLVARKVTLQNDKRDKIKNAFLNPKIQRIWEQKVVNYFTDEEIQTFVEDQFDSPEEKFCFIQIKDFVLKKLSTEEFGDDLRKYCVLQQIDDDLSFDFKFEFLLAEEFSFTVLPCLMKDSVKPIIQKVEIPQSSNCSIM